MSQENLEIVRRIYDAYGERDNATPFDWYAADVEWDISELGVLGATGVYHGHDGVRSCFRDVLSAFREFELRADEVRDAGDRVLATVWEHGVGRASGAVVDRHHHAVWTLRDAKVVRMGVFLDRGDAERATGLKE